MKLDGNICIVRVYQNSNLINEYTIERNEKGSYKFPKTGSFIDIKNQGHFKIIERRFKLEGILELIVE